MGPKKKKRNIFSAGIFVVQVFKLAIFRFILQGVQDGLGTFERATVASFLVPRHFPQCSYGGIFNRDSRFYKLLFFSPFLNLS